MKEDWIEDIRRRLEGHTMKEPDGLWESISNALDSGAAPPEKSATEGKRRRAAVVPIWLRAVSAAAVAAIAVIIGYGGLADGGDGNATAKEETTGKPATELTAGPQAAPQADSKEEQTLADATRHTPGRAAQGSIIYNNVEYMQAAEHAHSEASQAMTNGLGTQENGNAATNGAATASADSKVTDGKKRKETPEEKREEPGKETTTERKRYKNLYESEYKRQVAERGKAEDGGIEIGITAGNGLIAYNSNVQGAMRSSYLQDSEAPLPPQNDVYSAAFPEDMKYGYLAVGSIPQDEEVHHDTPLKLGLSLRYALNSRWAVESGLTYTRLRSTFTSGSDDNYQRTVQRLNYIGIPLNVIYTIWNYKGLGIYASAGGEAAKCVSGTAETETVIDGRRADGTGGKQDTERPWQLSVNGAVGIQYTFVRNLSLYVEPSLGYYFSNGSSVKTYYDKHPLAPGIKIGLRLQIR